MATALPTRLLAQPHELPADAGGASEHSVAHKGRATEHCAAHKGTSSLKSTASNMVLTVLGAGQLTLPYAMSQLGLAAGIVSLLVFALLSAHSCWTLSLHTLRPKWAKESGLASYSELVAGVLGRPGELVCTCVAAIYAWGGGIGFLMILKGELGYVAERFGAREAVLGLDTGLLLMLLVSCLVLWPLSSMHDVSRLKIFSPLACLAAVFILVVVLLCTPWGDEPCSGPADSIAPPEHSGSIKWFPESLKDVAMAVPLLAFALNSSWAFINIFTTLEQKTTKRTAKLIGLSNLIIFAQYLLLSSSGYYTFCESISQNVLDVLGGHVKVRTWRGGLVCVARAALALQLSIGLPMRFIVTRDALARELSLPKRMCASGFILGSAVALAATGLSLAFVLGVVSSICASLIIYILPAIIDLASDLEGTQRKALSMTSLGVGLFVMVGGLAANLTGAVQGG